MVRSNSIRFSPMLVATHRRLEQHCQSKSIGTGMQRFPKPDGKWASDMVGQGWHRIRRHLPVSS